MTPPKAYPAPPWPPPGVARREPLPPAIPRRLPERLVFFEALWAQLAADALATLGELKADGWTETGAREALDGYVLWVSGNVAHAVELAVFLDGLGEVA